MAHGKLVELSSNASRIRNASLIETNQTNDAKKHSCLIEKIADSSACITIEKQHA